MGPADGAPVPGAGTGTGAGATAGEIAEWLRETVADLLDRPPGDIEADVPLAEYGVDSIYVEGVCAEIEDRFDIKVEAELVWAHPTLVRLSEAILALTAPD
jgi:acyl carrier protein